MHRAFVLCAAALLVVGFAAAARPAGFGQPIVVAAGTQPFFSGYWRCASGSDLRVTPQFGPWFTWRSQSSGAASQAAVYNDPSTGAWVNVGVDSAGGYWTQTSSGWQGNTMTYNGTYTNHSRSQSQRQVLTKVANNRFNVATYRNGALSGQNSCTRS